MRITLSIIFLLVFAYMQAQSTKTEKLNCLVLIDQKFTGDLYLYSKNGKVIKKLHNNLKDEDYIVIKIIGKNDSMYKVVSSYAIAGFISNGWIKRSSKVIGVFSRAYSSELLLYKFPKKSSEVESKVEEYAPDFFYIKDCQNNWLLIDTKIGDKTYIGWMEPNMQCANAYSGCN